MRLLVDENIATFAITALRQAGHDVVSVSEVAPRIRDSEIFAWGQREKRIIVTFDKDFGDLIFREQLPAAGVVLVRAFQRNPTGQAEFLLTMFVDEARWIGRFSTIDEDGIRQRPLP
jgi:predicted nuclease of predicted toxin-antitoxin system